MILSLTMFKWSFFFFFFFFFFSIFYWHSPNKMMAKKIRSTNEVSFRV